MQLRSRHECAAAYPARATTRVPSHIHIHSRPYYGYAAALMNFANQMGEWERSASCRDKGWDGVDVGALCLSSWRIPHLAGGSTEPKSGATRTSTRPLVPT